MKQNQKLLLGIGLGLVILLNILILSWLLSDFFSGPNGPEESIAASNNGEETVAKDVSTEETTEATPVEQIVKKIAEKDAKKLIRAFEWGDGEEQLGYDKENDDIKHLDGFAVEDGVIYILDVVNHRILVCEGSQYRQIDLGSMTQGYGLMYRNGKIAAWGKCGDKDVLMLCKKDGSTMMMVDIPGKLTGIGSIQRILEIGETYVVFELLKNNGMDVVEYHFDWVNGSVTYDPTEIPSFFKKESGTEVIGIYENEVFHSSFDKYLCTNVISRESETTYLYTEIQMGVFYDELQNGIYLSSDGRLYMMECFADGVEISEIVLNEEFAEAPTTEQIPSEPFLPETEQVFENSKREIYTLLPGDDSDQVGYGGDRAEGLIGPEGFAIEGNDIYILDRVNERIFCKRNQAMSTHISVRQPEILKYENGLLAVIHSNFYGISVYSVSGVQVADISLQNTGVPYAKEIVSIDDTGVVFNNVIKGATVKRYRYDWLHDKLELLRAASEPERIMVGGQNVAILGKVGDRVYYQYREGYGNEAKNIIGVEVKNVGRWYVTQELSDYRSIPSANLYISEEGKLYLMECFEERTVISELILGEFIDATGDGNENTGEESTEELTTEDVSELMPSLGTEQMLAEVRRPIYNRYAGSEERDVGYAESVFTRGPTEFTVEDNNICILDVVNNRIICHEIETDVATYSTTNNVKGLCYQNNYYAVTSGTRIIVYGKWTGGVVADIDLRDKGIQYVTAVVSIDDTAVVFEILTGQGKMLYHYDWSKDSLEILGEVPETSEIEIGGQKLTILGEVGDRVYYQYREGTKNIIGVEVKNVGRWYVTQELSGYHSVPTNNLYVSRDGKLYVMECFEDQTVISELMLGDPDKKPTEDLTEDSTKEPTPYDEVLNEYFAKREALYTATEEPEFDPQRWQYLQKRKESWGAIFTDAEVTYKNVEVISETDSEVKLKLWESAKITYVYDGYYAQHTMYDSLPHIIRLSKQDGKYQIQTDSCWDMMTDYQTGLEEDIELLKQR